MNWDKLPHPFPEKNISAFLDCLLYEYAIRISKIKYTPQFRL